VHNAGEEWQGVSTHCTQRTNGLKRKHAQDTQNPAIEAGFVWGERVISILRGFEAL
jgi:hypothetical protein